MYVRCPRCKSEISFEPQNTSSLGETYKIKCPNCGATIGAKLPTKDELFNTNKDAAVVTDKKAKKVAKKSGAGRNVVMLLLSLIIVGLNIVSYIYVKKILPIDLSFAGGVYLASIFNAFRGIECLDLLITHFSTFQGLFTATAAYGGISGVLVGITAVFQIAIFIFAALNFLAAFICLIGRTYSRSYNLLTNFFIGACSVVSFFMPFISGTLITKNIVAADFVSFYGNAVMNNNDIGFIVLAGVGLLCLFFSLCFLASMKKKEKAPKKAKRSK